MPTGPDTSFIDSLPVINCPRLATVVTIQYFTSTKLYFNTSRGLPPFSSNAALKPSVYVSYSTGWTVNSCSVPSRSITNLIPLPLLFTEFIVSLNSPALDTLTPSTDFIMSPALIPAFSNEPPSVTCVILVPSSLADGYEKPKRLAL